MPKTFRQWIFAKPLEKDAIQAEQFALREMPIPELRPDQALVRVRLLNIHSATRHRMVTGITKLGDTDYSNYACAEVIRSRDRTFREGDLITCQAGWQDYQVISSLDQPIGYKPPNEPVKVLNGTNSQWNYVFRPLMVMMWRPEVLMEVPRDAVAVAGVTGPVGSHVCWDRGKKDLIGPNPAARRLNQHTAVNHKSTPLIPE